MPDFEGERALRRGVLTALLIITALSGLLFFVINLQRGALPIAVAELVAAFCSLALLPVVRRTQRLTLWGLVYLLPFFGIMMLALATPQASITVFVWIYLIPLLSHLLLGQRLGLIVAVVYLIVAALLYAERFARYPEFTNTAAWANVVICALVVLVFSHVYERGRAASEQRLQRLAGTDSLTGLANRAYFTRSFERERAQALRRGAPLSLLLLDLDHFKLVNDTYGHEAGDAVLIRVGQLLQRRLRAADLPCRLGGEEFAVLLPDTAAAAAAELAETLRALLASGGAAQGSKVTASIGVAELGPDGEDFAKVYGAADRRLYAAKDRGRNCVVSRP